MCAPRVTGATLPLLNREKATELSLPSRRCSPASLSLLIQINTVRLSEILESSSFLVKRIQLNLLVNANCTASRFVFVTCNQTRCITRRGATL